MRTPEQAQIARVKWLLQLTRQAVSINGFTDRVIDILAPAFANVLDAEGFYLAYQSTVDRAVEELEREGK